MKSQVSSTVASPRFHPVRPICVRVCWHCHLLPPGAERSLIITDTKFEFGLVDHGNELILIDEALTPDSSRYWPLEGYAPGRGQPSFDKQYLRDWLTSQGFRKGLEKGPDGQGWTMSEEVVQGTRERYLSARDTLLKSD